ncbi:penicillin acylase family protein [Echinicola jeungdonensis]|uniref:Penicillin acylase family protein n=1 Tax=Echinicola jeungdonensis TaxID=709343 RepID=A0ABV5J3P0_9BACT|nr:penicillin acylase family protein [Echinicola jeungdonensis]MDN3668140.1 penicillin acylase family protein [Echinicola jeungdonensis]
MKYLGFLIALILTLTFAIGLSVNLGQIPPLGILFDPNHGFWQNAYSEDDKYDNSIDLEGLNDSVRVAYDENLIPHLFASNEKDLMMAQGYVTAQHRLWQMEFQTMAAAGRVAELVGKRALDYDRMQRRKGLGFSAEVGLQFLKKHHPETLVLIEAYTSGVNQFIDELGTADLPVEYKILDYRPEHWNAYKTILLLKYMADMLVGDKDIEYTNLHALLGEETMQKLFPDFPNEMDPVIESDKEWDFTPYEINKPEDLNYPDSSLLIQPIPTPEPGVGSNNWAVDGSKTQSGNPILANDPHLNLNLPSLWYAMQLSTPEYSVKGVTLPGALGVIIGFNENIAWGMTNATRDVRDWYAIRFKSDKKREYLYNDQWIQSTLRVEKIQVKDDTTYMDSVVYTHYGPVVYDETFRGNGQKINFSLKWTAHEGSNEQLTFLELNRARNHQDYLQALDHFTSPAQNFAFASNNGDIAMKVQGKFPLKWPEQGKYLMDGNNPAFEWKGYIPADQNPSTLNPERGFVSSANQHSTSQTYPYYIFDDSFEHYRNRRINTRLLEMENITIKDMQNLQMDDYYLHAAEALPVMLDYLLEDTTRVFSENTEALIDSLQNWNLHAQPQFTGPTLFTMWWEQLMSLTWGKYKREGMPIVFPSNYQTTKLLRDQPEDSVFDNPETNSKENAKQIVEQSFLAMERELNEKFEEDDDYSWANYKKTSIQHLAPNFTAFGVQNIPTGGGKGIVNATSHRKGASWRMVVEMGDEITGKGIFPGGQSGNPGSKYYCNFVEKWARGAYLDFNINSYPGQGNWLFSSVLMPND